MKGEINMEIISMENVYKSYGKYLYFLKKYEPQFLLGITMLSADWKR